MKIGSRIGFPEGYGGYSKTDLFYLVRNSADTGLVTFVEFIRISTGKKREERRARFRWMSRDLFEEGLSSGAIKEVSEPTGLPEWLEKLSGVDLRALELSRRGAKRSNYQTAEARYMLIAPLLGRQEEILDSKDPEGDIARWTRDNAKDKHPGRITFWFCCCLVFGGNNIAAVYPDFLRNGRWDRKTRDQKTPLGRAPNRGSGTYYHVNSSREKKIEESYVNNIKPGKKQREIYYDMLRTDFSCSIEGTGNKRRIVSVVGEPFPTPDQVRHHVGKKLSPRAIDETIYGSSRMENEMTPSRGSYSQGIANVLQKVEGDGWFRKDRLKGPDGKPLSLSFCVVRLIDVASGERVGVGFSLGGERVEAYKVALFCAAIEKAKFCRLFGLDIPPENWNVCGVPSHVDIDRGAGSGSLSREHDSIPWQELARSYMRKDKANIESSHPRTIRFQGKPVILDSDLTPVAAAKQEILRVMKENWSADVSSRLTPQMIADSVVPNPANVWRWLEDHGRVSGHHMSFDDAVRQFLSPVKFTLSRDSLRLVARRFGCSAQAIMKIRERLRANQQVTLSGYALELCVRYAWVEVEHRLIEVEAELPIFDDATQLYAPLSELENEKRKLAALKLEAKREGAAAEMEYRLLVKQETGVEPDAGRYSSTKSLKSRKNATLEAALRRAVRPGKA